MQLTAGQWCNFLGGKLEGNSEILITHPAKIEDAGTGAISFIANPKYLQFAESTKASALIVSNDFITEHDQPFALIRVDQPYISFTRVLEKFNKPFDDLNGIHETAAIDSSAKIGDNVFIGAHTYVGKSVTIGNNVKIFAQVYLGDEVEILEGTVLYPGVKVYNKCKIGRHCVIHSGVVIGSDGFGFAPQPDGTYLKVPQLGNVLLEDNVEVGSNTTIDRATLGSTIIRRGAKIDNLVQVAHNVEIGENTVIAAQSGISGSTKIGRNCMIGGQVGFVGHIEIADGSRINAQSGVSKSIKEKNKAWNGAPAFDFNASLRSQSVYRNLPDLQKRIEALEKRLMKTDN